jgi:hypothetical protein
VNDPRTQAVTHLGALATALNKAGLQATLQYGNEIPYVQVINPKLISSDPMTPGPVLSEQIRIVHQAADPEWLLCWAWGASAGPADHVPGADGTPPLVLTLAPANAHA